MSESTVKRLLAELARQGLVTTEGRFKTTVYRLAAKPGNPAAGPGSTT